MITRDGKRKETAAANSAATFGTKCSIHHLRDALGFRGPGHFQNFDNKHRSCTECIPKLTCRIHLTLNIQISNNRITSVHQKIVSDIENFMPNSVNPTIY